MKDAMKNYAIFGAGRVGGAMAAYLEHLGHRVRLISRRDAETAREACAQSIEQADIIAAAIPDDRLAAWRDEWRGVTGARPMVHFSGALVIDGMYGFHPLYSFPKSGLRVEAMKDIAFACSKGGPRFSEIFPHAPNPSFEIPDEDRARYHALAVVSGNLASFLWNETAKEFAAYSDLPADQLLASYFASIVERFRESPTNSMTGPLARKDRVTVEKNLAGLAGNPKLAQLYDAFLKAAWPEYPDRP